MIALDPNILPYRTCRRSQKKSVMLFSSLLRRY